MVRLAVGKIVIGRCKEDVRAGRGADGKAWRAFQISPLHQVELAQMWKDTAEPVNALTGSKLPHPAP